MKIDIICVGNLKGKNLKALADDYFKRISKYAQINLIEIKEQSHKDNPLQVVKAESELLQKHLKSGSYLIVLDIKAKQLPSEEFASLLEKQKQFYSHYQFIIGGSDGLAQEIKEKANYALSFSEMTFPHQLFRVMLLEQIYRAFKINQNETYHK